MRITTDRLILRRPQSDDVGDLLHLLSDPSFAAAVPEIPRDESNLRTYVKNERALAEPELHKCFNLFSERREDRRLVGLTTMVLRKHDQGEIGYALHREYRGHGYASEAARAFIDHVFAELGLHRIYAETRAHNTASWKVMERLGMRREACFRKMVLEEGDRRDLVIYAVLAEEWRPR